jgi:glycosyltransferase involved in cell wall biosynthesis
MISIICVVKNGLPYLENTIKSFLLQDLREKELIIIYSKSNDGTENVLKNFENSKKIRIFYDTKSTNKFQSINKGINLARGEIIGLLHSDDVFFSSSILSKINKFIHSNKVDGVYGDILIVKRNKPDVVKRVWIDKNIKSKNLREGWMPAHTSLFLKKKIFKELNNYSDQYIISSDYNFILKLFNSKKFKIKYLNKFITIMRDGGDSANKLYSKFKEDYIILRGFNLGFFTLVLKSFYKIPQYFSSYKININKYLKKVLYQELNLSNDSNVIDLNKPKIFLALNLATTLYIVKKKISFDSLVFWKDGLMSYLWDKNNYDIIIPGREYLKNLNYDIKLLKCVYILGNINPEIKKYFNDACKNKEIFFIKLPIFKINKIDLVLRNINIKKKSLILINISTPKQEILAERIFLKTKSNILCLGAAPLMLSGIEKIPPVLFTILKIEALWRLRKNFLFRVKRIIQSLFFYYYYFSKINANFILKRIN